MAQRRISTWRAVRERKTEHSVRRNEHRTLNIDLASHLGDIGNLMIAE
jgi:hypothetical protein